MHGVVDEFVEAAEFACGVAERTQVGKAPSHHGVSNGA